LCYDEHGFIYGMRASDTNFYAYNIAQNEWQKKKSLPIKTKSGFGLIYGADDTIYVVTKNQKIVYRYSVVSNEWYLAESLPVKPKTHSAFCRQGDYIYALLGDTLFYRYSLEHNTWQQLKALPVKAKNGTSITSSDDGYIYAITGNKKAFHRYSISANNWSLLDSAPYPIKKGAGLASIGNIIYCLPGGKIKKFYKYEPGSGWYELDSVPIVIKGGNSITPAQGDIYCLLGSSTNLFFRYIPESATKKASSDLIGSLTSNVYTIIYPQLSQTRQNKFSLPQTIIIYNVLGKTILQTTLENKNQLYELIKNLPRGVFFISDNDKNHLRIIKSHY
ncbi:MAG: hypothetical protein N2166_01525, partial [candidate division WOR-3 bacterium]|nr:hypothetical protein [candidate division WOR-3 bacterium]